MLKYQFNMARYVAARCAIDTAFRINVDLCEMPIKNLVGRYNLAGSNILSLGAGDGFEEAWLADAGCRLTMIDLSDPVRKYVDDCKNDRANDRYFVADAADFVAASREKFDVLYISSFHPDEIRREEIQREFMARRTEDERLNYVTWPAGTDPYHDMIVGAFKLVAPKGLLIFQHYRGGVDTTYNRQYFDDVIRQLANHGITLVEEHHFRRSPQHMLLLARKTSAWKALLYRSALINRPLIKSFHGRYPDQDIKTGVESINPWRLEKRWARRRDQFLTKVLDQVRSAKAAMQAAPRWLLSSLANWGKWR